MALLTALVLFVPTARAGDWLTQMRAAWDSLQSYRSEQRLLERVDGTLREERVMRAAYRKPGELQLTFGDGKRAAKAYHAEHRFEGSIRMRHAGRAGQKRGILTVPWDNADLRALAYRSVADLDLGAFVNVFSAIYGSSTTLPTPSPDVVGEEPAWRVDLVGDVRNGWSRAELCLSQRTNLPVRVVFWDAQGVMLERHQWSGFEVNPVLVESVDFDLGGYPAATP